MFQIDLVHNSNQVKAIDEIPSTTRNLHLICFAANVLTDVFHALLTAMRTFKVNVHIT